ncbi:hypothetical protein, partial [Massilia glaciei]|uniref:hypothetical protein n=1 Tax=Massilia glaciei TaxID=1524097 RepID=UPI001C625070
MQAFIDGAAECRPTRAICGHIDKPQVDPASSLPDLKNRSENSAERGQISTILKVNSYSIDQKIGEIWTAQADLQPISFKVSRPKEFRLEPLAEPYVTLSRHTAPAIQPLSRWVTS